MFLHSQEFMLTQVVSVIANQDFEVGDRVYKAGGCYTLLAKTARQIRRQRPDVISIQFDAGGSSVPHSDKMIRDSGIRYK